MSSSDEESLSERSCISERSFRSERSGGSLSPCPHATTGPKGDTLPWNLSRHERRKRKSQDSVLDPAERAVVRVADERDRVQKKTFTKWVNKHLIKVRKHITDLYEDLRDGHNLISLLEVLSGVTLPREKGRMRFHRLQNVQIALDFLKQRQVKLVNIRNDDITDGNPKLTLGLIWTIILHFQISEIYVSGESGDLTAKEKLLLWTQQATEGYHGLRCVNFSSSWSDGRMFNALLHRYRPDLIDMEVVAHQTNRENLEQAFEIAESLGVTRLLDAEDVDVPSPDEKSVITYVSSIYDAFPKIPEGGEGIKPHEVDQQWAEYQSRFSSLLQWTRQHTALMANKGFPQNPVELKALYNEYIHFKETEIPAKELEKGHIKHLYKLLEVWIEFGRIKLPQGLHPNDLEEEWGKLILEMLEREKALRPAVERLELLLQKANKFQNMAVDCEEKLTLAKNTLQVDTSHLESGEPAQCEQELGAYLQDCEALVRQLHLDLQVLRDEKYYQVEQLAFRVTRLQEELVSLRLQCSSVYRKGHFSSGGLLGEQTAQRGSAGSLPTLGAQTLLGAIGAVATLMRQPMSRSDLVAISSSEDEGSLRFIYELLGWVEETQELLERAEWGSDLPSVEQHLQDHHTIHTTVEELLHSLKEARSYEVLPALHYRPITVCEWFTLPQEHSSWRLRCLESLRAFVSHCTEELIWLNEKEEEELAFDWSENTTNMTAKREQYTEMRSELEEKQKVMRSLQETADQLCQDNHPAKQTVEAYSAALQTQWQWVRQLCICVEQHLKDNTAYFLFMSDARECETYLRQLQDTIKRQYTCDKNSRLGKLEDLLQDSMEEKEQLIEYRSSVASLVGRAKTVVQLRPRSADCILGTTTPIRAICDYRQIEITVSKGEECVLEDNSQRTKWKIISPTGNEAMVPSVCFTVPPPNKEAIDTANRMEQLYQNVMSLWHQLHMNMKSVVTWHYLQKDINNILSWTLDTVRSQSLSERQQALEHLNTHLTDFLADSHESTLFTPSERRELEKEVANCGQHCQALLISMETVEKDESISRSYLSELQSIKSHLQEAEQRLMKGLQASPPSGLSGGGADTAIHIAEQEKLQQDLKGLQSDLGNVSRRCVSFFEEKPTSSSVPVLRSELNLAVEKIERLNSLSSVYLQKLKTVDVLMRSLQVAESQVKKYEGRLSEEDIVPADTTAIQALREQLNKWHLELEKQDHIFQSLSLEMQQAREAGTQLSQLHSDRSPEMDRYQEKAHQLTERWNGVRRQMETRLSDLEMLGSVLQQYRAGHSALIHWIEETTAKQENTQPEQTDSKALSEQLTQQTALVAEIEQNQVKLDECQNHSKHYCTAVKDYELQLMTFRAFVESTQKSPVKRRRMHSSSDAITQEFMDLRTRYTALVTLTTQHVKYISDALRRLEEEEKQVEEERQARVGEVSELLSWVKGLQERPAESSLAAQQAVNEQLASKKEGITEAIRSTEVFLLSKQASKLSAEERAQVTSQLDDLTATYKQLCDSSAAQLQQLEEQLAKEEKRKVELECDVDVQTSKTEPNSSSTELLQDIVKDYGHVDSESSLARQECLEHDQRILALLSMVRHTEVCLKQQQQQSIGRSLLALDDIIKQTETLALELCDLEPQVNKELEASRQLLGSHLEDVPPQLLMALEKDGRSLSRAFDAARELSQSVQQGMKSHRDARKMAVNNELQSLGGQVDNLLVWLKQTEAQMEQHTREEKMIENESRTLVHLAQRLQQCKELEEHLAARSSDVSTVAFDIQVFISECAQDLEPEQSRHLLRQLQQLQRAFHQATGRAHARAEALSVQQAREEEREQKEKEQEEREREKEKQTAMKKEVVQRQKEECSQKLEGLTMWLAGAAGLLASQRTGADSGDVGMLQKKQSELKEVQKDLQAKGDVVIETIRSVEDVLAEHGDDLSQEERANLQRTLSLLKEQYSTLTETAQSSLAQLDTAISTTLQQNTQKAKAEEELQETQGKIDMLFEELSSSDVSKRKALGETVPDSPFDISPEGAVNLHSDRLKAELQHLQAQQAHLLQVAQSTRSLLEQPDSSVPPEEKQRLRVRLDQLQSQHQEHLQSCQEKLRRTESLRDDLTKFLQEHGTLGTWLEQSERGLCSIGQGEADAQALRDRLEEHKKLAEDVICHKADLRFVSISGQKVLDSVQGALERMGGTDPALEDIRQLVNDKLQDASHRYSSLQNKSVNLGTHLSTLLDQYQQYQDEASALDSWLNAQEQNQSIFKPSGEKTDTQALQNTLNAVKHLQDELAERSMQLEKVKKAGKVLTSTHEFPTLKATDITTTTDALESRLGALLERVSQRAEQLQTAVAQSVSVQEGLKALLAWLDGLALTPGPVQPTAQAVQDALTQNQKLRQELLSRQGSVEATRDSVSKLLKSADASTVSGLQGALQDLIQHYTTAQTKQAENEAELRGVLPKLESFDRLSMDLHSFMQSRERALSLGGQPDRSIEDYRHTVEEVKSELSQEASQLKSFVELGTDLSQSRILASAHGLLDSTKEVSEEFSKLEGSVNEKLNAIQSCEQQLSQFRSLSGSLLRWLQTVQEQLPAKEPSLNTDGLQRRVQQLKDLLSEWESQGSRVQELNKSSSELESLIIDITASRNNTGVSQLNGAGSSSSINGIHTCKDLTEIQVAMSEVNSRYEQLGGNLQEKQSRQQVSLEMCLKAKQDTETLLQWLGPREQSLTRGQIASPSRPEVVQAQARENKALLSELSEHSGKVEDLKNTLKQLITENPDSPEAETWKQQLKDIDCRWEKANKTAAQRQTELETCADRLGSFASAASQLGPWLREKELMMSVLGPLSIDPNMLNTQKQQVQFMLREFETRRPQFDQLTQAAEGILSPTGEQGSGDGHDLVEVQQELADITRQWDDLTSRLSERSEQIDQAQGTSERFQTLLRELSMSAADLAERLDAQASLSAQPEALRRRLQETGEIRAELEQRKGQLAKAEELCAELSAIVAEPYLREELHKRLESVSGPLSSLEERAADGLSQLQSALSSTQQFQQMFEELRSWLDGQAGEHTGSVSDPLPCQPEALQTLLTQQEELLRGVAQQRGSYELIQAEGASLLASLPTGNERSALQAQLATLRQDWEGLNQCLSEKQVRVKETLSRAEQYKQHRDDLAPWVTECEKRETEILPSLDAAALDDALQKAKQLGLDLDRRRPLLEALNLAADQLLEQSRTGEEEVRDEKAQLNRRLDSLSEKLHGRTTQLEELGNRLREFEEGRQAVERRLEAAKHQLEVQEALGPQACSNKSLERLRSQQEMLNSLQPQVVYLRDLAKGLVQDMPQAAVESREGRQHLVQQVHDAEREFEEVTDKIEQCCSSLESRLQGVGEVQSHVRDVFSRLADLDDELDSLSPVGRDADSLASQAEAVKGFLGRLATLRAELEGHGGECTTMLRREGSSPDLLALRRETEALSRQAAKLAERGQGRLSLIEAAEERVREFYARLAELQGLLDQAEEGVNAQGVVGTEVDVIKQQLLEFKAVEREQIDSIQPKLQHVNAVGQGLIQSAAKHTDTQALEHDLETTNLRWNSLNKRVAERIAQLQEALLHCGKFQDALEPLLSWLSDTEELIANQKPPSAEYRVVKAQIQEQKLLQRLLDDRRGTVEMIMVEGERIAATAESQDRDKIQKQLQSLGVRWKDILEKASGRQQQLEELQVLALQFHETVEPLGEWLSATERRLSSAEPMGTQTSKITQQISRHKALQEEVLSRGTEVDGLEALGQSLSPLSCVADRDWLSERVGAMRNGHTELRDWCSRREAMLEQALANAQLFGEEEVEVLNWLAEVAQRLAEVSVQSYQPELLAEQHKHTLSLNEEIVSRKKTVDQAIKNGQALLKQTTGEEVLLIQEKLDGIKSRYAEMTAGSSKALRTLEQALQLATRFASAHEDLNQWLDSVEAELNNVEPDTTPAYQDRQKELKCVSAEKRLVLDTVNEVGSALLDLVPWRAREGLDRLVADANQRYRQADETITQRKVPFTTCIYEEAVDAELAWVGETERKLVSLGPLSLEPDVTVAQLQVQRAFNIDIIRHKDTVDQLLNTREDILESCSELQREALKIKTDSLNLRYEAVSQNHAERFSALEQAQVLVARFWETYEELEPWLGETETLISQLPPPAIDTEALRQQQDQMRLLRESIAEHKPHIDKLLKIGPQLAELSAQEGTTVRQRYSGAERRYLAIKEEVKNRATALDEAFSQSAQFHDKMDPLLETLEGAVQRLRQPPPVAAEVEKIREQLAEHRAAGLELDKLLPSFSALCSRGEELITRAPHDDPAAQAVRSRLLRLRSLWDEIRQRAEEREGKLQDVLDLAGKFWSDMAALLSTLRDSQEIVKELEDPGVDPSLIKQQIEAAEAIKAETDGLREELEIVRTLGADLIFACGETEKPEVKKTIDEMNAAWEGLNRTWRERMEKLDEAMTASVQYQDALQGMFDYLDNAVIKLCDMPAVGTDLSTVKQQIEELKQYKVEVYQQQIDMEKLCHQGELLLKKVTDQTDRDMIQEPLTELRHLWDNLGDKITLRQHKLEGALLALGQFQHALSELQSWLSHTHATLDTQRPISSDPKAIEIELAKHHVLRNDVLSHRATVETVNSAGSELLDSSPGDEASHLRDQLDELNRSWDSVLLKTEERQKLLEAALQQAEGFHGELEEFLQWLRRTESQLSAAKPTGGLPETAREQLQQHMELQVQLTQRGEQYHRLLDQGESMLLARGGEEAGPGTTQTQQNLALLQNKWASLNTKMDDRRAKLEEAVSLATGFQSSLQDTINWLTQAEQTLNMAQPPSLILDTVLFQIDEHKVFVNEVNTHREQVLALEKVGSQLRFASLKQDVVLIKNLLLSVQARWDKLVQRSLDRGRHLDEARKRAKQFHEAWRKLTDWLEEAESRLDSELEISNEPDKIKVQLAKHKEFQKALGSKQPVYDTTVRSGKAMRDKATLPADTQKLDNLLGEVRDKWDTVCGKSVERQHKLEEALLFSGQFAEALQALVDWLYRVEPQLAEDQPVHGDLDLVSNLMDSHKAFQKELGKRTSSVQALKRSARELMETGRDDTAWVKVQVQELSNRWDTVCALSVTKQTRLQQALKQAEEFRTAVQMLLEWLSEAEQTLRFRGVLPEEAETLQELLHTHRDFMQTVEEKRVDVNKAAGMGEAILAVCHPDCITTIKHWITIIRARFEEVLTWTKQHEQRLEGALTELLNNAALLEELLSWLQWAETTLVQRDTEPLPQDIPQLKTLITEHQVFMEEMTRKQPDVDKVTKTYKRKPAEPASGLAERRGARKQQQQQQQQQHAVQVTGGNPRLTQLCSRWQQVWLLALDRQRKLHDALDRLEELKEFANFDFDVWRKKYMRWMNHKKSRVMDFFRRIDKDQDGKITRQEFIDGILASKFPTSKLEMSAVADIFDRDGDGYIDYYEFVAALHPNKDAYRPTTDADKIEDEVTRQVAQCKCAKRFQVEQIGENKYRFFLGNQFGDSQQLRLVRILRSTVMVRVGGGWMALDEFLVKNDPCRARGRTNLELREKFILPEGASQGLAAFRSRGRRSKPSSRTASPTRSSSSASQSAQSCTSLPSAPATPTASSRSSQSHSRGYAKPWLAHSKTPTPTKCQSGPEHSHTPGHEGGSTSKLKRPTFHSSRGSLTGENGGATPAAKPGRSDNKRTPTSASGPTSRAGSRAGSRASSRRGSDASDASELMETRSACSDTSDTPRRPGAKASKIPTMKKTPSPKTPAGKK
uniref:Microtubule actin crosslinking factor 1 n=1 Tax=Pygocentrus nattereri TaxID=42514 RepID=A0A3B4DMX6_PYGNA